MATETSLLEPEDHVLSTLEKDGSRRWLFPKLTKGYYWHLRRVIGFTLIAVFVLLPHWRINQKPAILMDVVHRKFTFFGFTFLPTDTLLLAIFMVSVFLSIFLLTALFGRVWCGWACPQTVYMEFVFRPIERFFDGTVGHGGLPRGPIPVWRTLSKYAVYFLLALGLAHTFLAYFVGVDRLAVWIRQSPFEHPAPFLVMAITTGLMLFDFCFFREQLCLIACPYGRFQSVLLDPKSLIVAYDKSRGEPRGKISKASERLGAHTGDCIDCGACVRTCPTGIDIRNGLQMECVHCTQCVDACDEIMIRVNKPTGLIRYSSQDGIEGRPSRRLRPRVIVYPTLLAILITAFSVTLAYKKSFDAIILRNLGHPFITTDEGMIQNSMRLKLVNRTDKEMVIQVELVGDEAITLDAGAKSIVVPSSQSLTQPILFTMPTEVFTNGKHRVEVRIQNVAGEERVLPWTLLGPYQPNPS